MRQTLMAWWRRWAHGRPSGDAVSTSRTIRMVIELTVVPVDDLPSHARIPRWCVIRAIALVARDAMAKRIAANETIADAGAGVAIEVSEEDQA